jgi:hypothetical protein
MGEPRRGEMSAAQVCGPFIVRPKRTPCWFRGAIDRSSRWDDSWWVGDGLPTFRPAGTSAQTVTIVRLVFVSILIVAPLAHSSCCRTDATQSQSNACVPTGRASRQSSARRCAATRRLKTLPCSHSPNDRLPAVRGACCTFTGRGCSASSGRFSLKKILQGLAAASLA